MTGRYFPLIGATHSPPMKSSRTGISTPSPIVTLKTHTHKQRNSHSSVKTSHQPTQKQSKQSKSFQQKSHYENPWSSLTKFLEFRDKNRSENELRSQRQQNIYKEWGPRTWMKRDFSLHSASITSLNKHNFHPCELTWPDPPPMPTRQYSVPPPPMESMWTSSIGS